MMVRANPAGAPRNCSRRPSGSAAMPKATLARHRNTGFIQTLPHLLALVVQADGAEVVDPRGGHGRRAFAGSPPNAI